MGEAPTVQALLKPTVDSHSANVTTLIALLRHTAQVLRNLSQQQIEMIAELRALLARTSSLRKADFDRMMQTVLCQGKERERDLREEIERFAREEAGMIAELRAILAVGDGVGPEDVKRRCDDLITQQTERGNRISRTLCNVRLDQEELAAGLKKLLAKAEGVRSKDLKSLIRGIHMSRAVRDGELGETLEEFRRVQEEVSTQWLQTAGQVMGTRGVQRGATASPVAQGHLSGV